MRPGKARGILAWKAVYLFEILDDVTVVSGGADLGDTEESDPFLLSHERWAGKKSTLRDGEHG